MSTRRSRSWGTRFRPRGARRANGKMFTGFQPAVSPDTIKKMGQQVRRWRIHMWTRHDLNEIAALVNPVVAGWMNYYGRFYRSQLYPLLRRVNTYLMRRAGKKYKRLRAYKRFIRWWSGVTERETPAVHPLGLDARAGRIAVRRAE